MFFTRNDLFNDLFHDEEDDFLYRREYREKELKDLTIKELIILCMKLGLGMDLRLEQEKWKKKTKKQHFPKSQIIGFIVERFGKHEHMPFEYEKETVQIGRNCFWRRRNQPAE